MTNSNSERPRSATGSRLGEFQLIADIFAPLASGMDGALGLTDDAGLIAPAPGHELVATVDALIEGVHFLPDDPPGDIARKSLRVNLSDLAAKGARPRAYLMALCLAPWVDDAWLRAFADGLAADQARYAIGLLGGDTTATPGPLTISITALGEVAAGRMIKRGGARAGDGVFVSGTIGDAGAGLAVLRGEGARLSDVDRLSDADRAALIARYRCPEPRTGLGPALSGLASAALDVSDGLLADLGHLAKASGVRLVLDADRLPLSPACRALWGAGREGVIRAAGAGDDYEIAFTAPPGAADAVTAAAFATGVPVRLIGHVEEGSGVMLRDAKGADIPVARTGFTHF
jgi:thiamine-monophosphate kinase